MNQEEKMNVQYDVYAKELLSQKEILARILKFTIAEFQDMASGASLSTWKLRELKIQHIHWSIGQFFIFPG